MYLLIILLPFMLTKYETAQKQAPPQAEFIQGYGCIYSRH
jgi:hypothetical protein